MWCRWDETGEGFWLAGEYLVEDFLIRLGFLPVGSGKGRVENGKRKVETGDGADGEK
jgi:hypothetical protein